MWEIRNRYILPTIPERPPFVCNLASTYTSEYLISRGGYYDFIEKYYKEGMIVNELIEKLNERLIEIEQSKAEILAVDVEVEIAEELEKVREQIRAEVVAKRDEKIADLELEHKALERLIAKEIAKVEAEAVVEEVVEGE